MQKFVTTKFVLLHYFLSRNIQGDKRYCVSLQTQSLLTTENYSW